MYKLICIAFFLLLSLTLSAQQTIKDIAQDKNYSAGNFRSYPVTKSTQPRAELPKGYTPFYISHIGRHGSRFHSAERYYKKPLDLLQKADAARALTARGDSLLQTLTIIYQDAEKRFGDLTPRGVREHKAIAKRMYENYPEVFTETDGFYPTVESRATMVVRCVLSMAAFNEGLKELNPKLNMVREASERYLDYMFVRKGGKSQYKKVKIIVDSLKTQWIQPERFISSVFNSKTFIDEEIKNPAQTVYDFFVVASIMQDVDYLHMNLYHLFTEQELYDLWRCINAHCYLSMGPSPQFGSYMFSDVKPLLKNFIETAQDVIDGKHKVAATLRFGHDCSIIPLAAMLGIKGASASVGVNEIANSWNVSEVSPMGTNLQMIFFKNKKGNIRVQILLNEKIAYLPLPEAPFYKWDDLKQFCESQYQ